MFCIRASRVLLFGSLLAGLCGCYSHGIALPDHWPQTPASDALLHEQGASTPKVRLVTCYSRIYSDHAALWVNSPVDNGRWLIWDPAGWIGSDFAGDGYSCLAGIVDGPGMTLSEYWRWRSEDYDGIGMLIFEWDLPPDAASRMYHALTDGHYMTDTPAGACAFAVAGFFQLYGPLNPPIFPICSYPAGLEMAAWGQYPDRVIAFRKGKPVVVLHQPGRRDDD